jgi:uncharacterized phiE125 gp8 family phage protein
VLEVPNPPVVIFEIINVYTADNTSAEFSAAHYYADTTGASGRIVLLDGVLPPSPSRVVNGIEVQFTAGYGGAASNVPGLLRQGMKQMIAHLYAQRGDTPDEALVASGAAGLFLPYRVMSLA